MPEKKASFGLGKKFNLSQAQQFLLLAALGSSIILGIAISLSLNFLSHISFNAKVIAEKDQAIDAYSTAISKLGVCKKPKDKTYTDEELKHCNPSTVDVNTIPGTLRYNIVNGLAVNPLLNSVPKDVVDSRCVNPLTRKNYSVKELNNKYIYAESIEERNAATVLLKTCSALRAIPDALPAYANQEAMLSSLNMIFNISGWEPKGLSPNEGSVNTDGKGYNGFTLSVSLDADVEMVQTVLKNMERSIRNIDITSANISYSGDESLTLNFEAAAYYVNKTELTEQAKVIDPNKTKGKK